MKTPASARSAVAHVRADHGVSERRACLVLGADRLMIRYRSQRPDDAEIRERLRELSRQTGSRVCIPLDLRLQAVN